MSYSNGGRRSQKYNSQERNSTQHYAHDSRGGKKQLSTAALIIIDILATGLGLLVFATFHHVPPFCDIFTPSKAPQVLATPSAPPTAEPTPTPDVTPDAGESTQSAEPTPTPRVYSGVWGEKFQDKFTTGEVEKTDTTYKSENINVTFTKVAENGVTYHVADIYISDIKYLRSAFATGEYKGGATDFTADIAARNNAIVAISGDHYGMRKEGIVIRNGVLYRETPFSDVCVLYNDGTMKTYTKSEFDIEAVKASGAWQAWGFGPKLLDNGQTMTTFNSELQGKNPRSAIGYVEPGHYILIEVDGRDKNDSKGMTLAELSTLFKSLGCVEAYNFDGGQSAGIAWDGKLISYPYGRRIADIVYIGEVTE